MVDQRAGRTLLVREQWGCWPANPAGRVVGAWAEGRGLERAMPAGSQARKPRAFASRTRPTGAAAVRVHCPSPAGRCAVSDVTRRIPLNDSVRLHGLVAFALDGPK